MTCSLRLLNIKWQISLAPGCRVSICIGDPIRLEVSEPVWIDGASKDRKSFARLIDDSHGLFVVESGPKVEQIALWSVSASGCQARWSFLLRLFFQPAQLIRSVCCRRSTRWIRAGRSQQVSSEQQSCESRPSSERRKLRFSAGSRQLPPHLIEPSSGADESFADSAPKDGRPASAATCERLRNLARRRPTLNALGVNKIRGFSRVASGAASG